MTDDGRGMCDKVLKEMEDAYSRVYTDMTTLVMQKISRGEPPELTPDEQSQFKFRLDEARKKADRYASCMIVILAGGE